ncbi:MAG: VCBS repeat-containing protein [Candidatus Latescibacteria bacterium]|nr:VCBS repeat-containing protein [Candidatus Latescibacterota bacterium]
MPALSGQVVDAQTGAPLSGANLRISATLGTYCDAEGRFALEAAPGNYTVAVSMIGYAVASVQVHLTPAGQQGLVFRLEPAVIPLGETLVEGLRPQLPHFVEVAAESGIHFQHVYGEPPITDILESTGAGAGFFDSDDDGDLDLYLVNGLVLGGDPRTQPSDALYRNEGQGRFAEVTAAAGIADTGYGMGCAAADYDNDGDQDLYVTNYGPNALYRNEGRGRFSEVAGRAGVADPRWSVAASWLDYDNDGMLDLFVANYLAFDHRVSPERSLASLHEGYRSYPGPRDYQAQPDALYRNLGDGAFAEVTARAGINPQGIEGKGMSSLATDFDGDGDLDLFVSNDRTPKQLYRNDGGHFSEVALWAGVAYDESGNATGAMGVDAGDCDGDGRLDLFVTNFVFEYNSLYRNLGDGTFADVTNAAGLALPSYNYVGWGTGFFDYDNDGWLDIFVANGHVHEDMDLLNESVSFGQPNQLFHNEGQGVFSEVSAQSGPPFLIARSSRGAAFGDCDGDGDLDVAVLNVGGPAELLRNEGGNREHWLGLRLEGKAGNRDAVGARVRVRAGSLNMIREVHAGSSYSSQSDLRLYFGLGGQTRVDSLEVRWPGGRVETFANLPVNCQLRFEEGRGYLP